MAVRGGTLFYADTAGDVLKLAASRSHKPGDVHVIELKGCEAEECPAETDGAHWAFTLITPEVMLRMSHGVFSPLMNVLQGRALLFSASESAARVAIMETIRRCSAPTAAAAPFPPSK